MNFLSAFLIMLLTVFLTTFAIGKIHLKYCINNPRCINSLNKNYSAGYS